MGNVELARSLYEAFANGDVATVFAAFDENINWREAENNPYQPSGEAWIGSDAIMNNLFIKLATEWDGFAVQPKEFHDAAGDIVVVEGRYTGTYKATGKSIDAQFCHVWKMRDGKLVDFQQYVDTAQMQEAFTGG
jgi:uncharacterized protein